ncbi:MAG: nucleotidyltransferase family protein, partial [Acidobacteriota bacterium]
MPQDVRRNLLQAYHRTGYRNPQLLKSLEARLALFASAGVHVTVLKGACLAQLICTDAGLRPFRDLDVLIPKDGFANARTALFDAGYAAWPETLADGLLTQYHFSLPFVKLDLLHGRPHYLSLYPPRQARLP